MKKKQKPLTNEEQLSKNAKDLKNVADIKLKIAKSEKLKFAERNILNIFNKREAKKKSKS